MVGVSHYIRYKIYILTDRFTESLISASVLKKSQLVTYDEFNPAHSFLGNNILRMMIRETEKSSREDSSKLCMS